jgi:hypothetical protein
MTPKSDGINEKSPIVFTTKGPIHTRRAVDLIVPARLTSPPSPSPFHKEVLD